MQLHIIYIYGLVTIEALHARFYVIEKVCWA